jgi:hypothetical protein
MKFLFSDPSGRERFIEQSGVEALVSLLERLRLSRRSQTLLQIFACLTVLIDQPLADAVDYLLRESSLILLLTCTLPHY